MASITARPTILTSQPHPAPPTEPTYLQRCYEELNLTEATQNERTAYLWNVAAKVAQWGFTVLAIGAFVTTGIYAFTFLPYAGLGVLFLLGPAGRFSQYLEENAKEPANRAAILKTIKSEYDNLPADALGTAKILEQMGIRWKQIPGVKNPEDLLRFRPLIARAVFLEKETQEHNRLANNAAQAASVVSGNKQTLDDKEALKKYQKASLTARQDALVTKTHAAFLYFVIQYCPDFQGISSDLYTMQPLSFKKRAIAREFKDPNANIFVKFPTLKAKDLTIQDVENDSIETLAKKMHAAYQVLQKG